MTILNRPHSIFLYFSMPQKDHMHSPGVRFHQLGLWGSDVINDLGWNLMSMGTLVKYLGHQDVSWLWCFIVIYDNTKRQGFLLCILIWAIFIVLVMWYLDIWSGPGQLARFPTRPKTNSPNFGQLTQKPTRPITNSPKFGQLAHLFQNLIVGDKGWNEDNPR